MPIGAPLNNEIYPTLQWVEVSTTFQIPHFQIIGLPTREVSEAKERIQSAIRSSKYKFPRKKVTLNLSPASIKKQGTGLDLAMALSVLSTHLPNPINEKLVAWGELSLEGKVKPIGQLTRTIFASWSANINTIIISKDEYEEAIYCLHLLSKSMAFTSPPPRIIPVSSLSEAWNFFSNNRFNYSQPKLLLSNKTQKNNTTPIFNNHSQLLPLSPPLKRILGVAAAGAHHLLLLGPQGTGKSHALDWLINITPVPSELLLVQNALLSELNQNTHGPYNAPPVRKIGASITKTKLVGSIGNLGVKLGELSLAHGGILIADELPEWSKEAKEILKEPLERQIITLNCSQKSIELPAKFALAATGNLCPCGGWPSHIPMAHNYNNSTPKCSCRPAISRQYFNKLTGPLLERIDILNIVTNPDTKNHIEPGEKNNQYLKDKVLHTRKLCNSYWGAPPGMISSYILEELLKNNETWTKYLSKHKLSLRGKHKVLRLALTLAAWDGKQEPHETHFFEATCYRPERLFSSYK